MEWNFRNDQPIYSQLTQRLTEAIVSGIYAPGAGGRTTTGWTTGTRPTRCRC